MRIDIVCTERKKKTKRKINRAIRSEEGSRYVGDEVYITLNLETMNYMITGRGLGNLLNRKSVE